MARRARVDAELVRRGLARSRQQAAELIGAGKVRIDGLPAVKPATAVSDTTALTVVTDSERAWVSRGAHKLVGALEAFAIAVAGRRCLDAGASTGGFTEVLLDRGAAHVVPPMSDTASWRGRCATILGWWSSSGPTHVASHRRRSAVASTW